MVRGANLAVIAAITLFAAAAQAEDDGETAATTEGPAETATTEPKTETEAPHRLAVARAARPLTTPALIFQPWLDFDLRGYERAETTWVNLDVGATFGITDRFAVHARVLPLQVAGPGEEGLHYGQSSRYWGPSIGAGYRLLVGAVEAAVGLEGRVYTARNVTGGGILPDASLRIHAGRRFRFDSGVGLNVIRATQTVPIYGRLVPITGPSVFSQPLIVTTYRSVSANAVHLSVPVSALYSIVEPVHVGVSTGVTIYDFDDVKNTLTIPAGAFAGYTIAGQHGPLLDIDASFAFPFLFTPGASSATSTTYAIGVGVGGHFYL